MCVCVRRVVKMMFMKKTKIGEEGGQKSKNRMRELHQCTPQKKKRKS